MADSTTNLDTISSAQAQKEVTANDLFDAASTATIFGRRASTTAGLTWGYYGGVITLDDTSLLPVANGTKTLTNAATNYVELDTSDGSIDVNTSGWTGGKRRLYEVVVAGGVVTGYTDWRTASSTGGVAATTAAAVSVADVGTFYAGSDVEAVLQEIGAALGGVGTGDVVGPAGATTGHLAVYSDTTGKLIADGGAAPTGTNTGDETAASIATIEHAATTKVAMVNADEMNLLDSAASFALKRFTFTDLKAFFKTYFDTLYAALTQPVVAAIFYPGAPTASALLGVFAAPSSITTITFAAAIAGSAGKALTAATAQTDIDVRKNATTSANGTSVGTIRFAAAGTVPTFIAASGFTLTGGTDYLSFWAPASPDATLANIAVSLYGTR